MSFPLPPVESRTNASADLPLFLCPTDRLPFGHKVAESFDPFVRGCLLAPEIEEIDTAADMILAAVGRQRSFAA